MLAGLEQNAKILTRLAAASKEGRLFGTAGLLKMRSKRLHLVTKGFSPVVDDGVDRLEIGVATRTDHFSLASTQPSFCASIGTAVMVRCSGCCKKAEWQGGAICSANSWRRGA